VKKFYPRRLSWEEVERFLFVCWLAFVDSEGFYDLKFVQNEFDRLITKKGVSEGVSLSEIPLLSDEVKEKLRRYFEQNEITPLKG